jgi:hypothetical protein
MHFEGSFSCCLEREVDLGEGGDGEGDRNFVIIIYGFCEWSYIEVHLDAVSSQ